MQAEINNKVVLSSSSSTREEAMVKIYDDPRGERGEESPYKICLSPQSQPQPQSGMREQQQNKNTMPTSKMNVCAFDLSCLAQHDPNLPPSKLPFAWKLYEMLETVHRGNNHIDTNIVSWVDDGTAFKVHKLQQFVDTIVPTYFKQTKYKSFQRQLYFYGFQRVSSSSSSSTSSSSSSKQKRGQQQTKTVGSYRHPMFVRGNKTLCLSMVPKKNKSSKSNSKIKSIVGTSTATATATATATTTTTTTTVTTSTATAANKTNKKLKELKQKQNQPQRSQQSDETEARDVCPRSPGRISMESNDDVVALVDPIVTTTGVINTTSKDNHITTSTAPVLDDEPIPLLRKVDHHHHSHQTDQADHVNKITNASFVDRQEQLHKQQREQFYRDLGLRDMHQYQHQHQPQSQPHQWQPQMNQQYHHQQQQQQQQQYKQQVTPWDGDKEGDADG